MQTIDLPGAIQPSPPITVDAKERQIVPLDRRHMVDRRHASNDWLVHLALDQAPYPTYADLFVPKFWAVIERAGLPIALYDTIRVRARDGSFDVILTVIGRATGGLAMELLSGRPPKGDKQ